MGLPRDRRLRQTRDIQRVQTGGRSWAHPLMILRALPNEGDQSRVAIVCGRRVGNAVVRNRVKRRLREIIRQAPIAAGWDIVVIARPTAAESSSAELARAFSEVLRRGRLGRPPPVSA